MPWSAGSFSRTNGTYSGAAVWQDDAAAAVNIEAPRHDTHDQDLATGIDGTLNKAGQNSPTANLPMGGFKHTGVSATSGASSTSEYTATGVVQNGAVQDAGDTAGTTTAYTATLTPAITAYADKQLFRVKFNATCGATPTINFNTVGAKKMYRLVGTTATQITTGDLPQNFVALLRYDTALDAAAGAFWVLNPLAVLSTPAASETVSGIAELATQAETNTGTDDLRIVTPLKLATKPGQLAQAPLSTQTGAVATGTTQLPYDDTIPQITEGDQYMTLAITPKNTNNILIIDVVWNGATSAALNMSVALFQDATANALASAINSPTSNGYMMAIAFRHKMTAGTTSATTFRVRAGGNGAGTTTFNGVAGARLHGGVMASSITIREYTP